MTHGVDKQMEMGKQPTAVQTPGTSPDGKKLSLDALTAGLELFLAQAGTHRSNTLLKTLATDQIRGIEDYKNQWSSEALGETKLGFDCYATKSASTSRAEIV